MKGLCLFVVMATASMQVVHGTLSSVRAHATGSSQFDFLLLQDSFFDCPNVQVLEGASMGLSSLEAAKQSCVSNPSCTYFSYNTETSQVYLCSDRDGFLSAVPRRSWTMGVKPSVIQRTGYATSINVQGVCSNTLSEVSVKSIDEAKEKADEIKASVLTMNMNKAAAVGPNTGALTAFLCNGRVRTLERNGFITMKREGSEGPPRNGLTFQAPCGLDGSIQPDSSKEHENIMPGQIVPATRRL